MTDEQYRAIERYDDNDMSVDERANFEATLTTDTALAEALNRYRQGKKALEAISFGAQKAKVRKLDSQQDSGAFFTVLKVAAAAVVLLLPLFYYLLQPTKSGELAMTYFEPYPDRVSVMGTPQEDLQTAMNAYNTGDYATALSQFKAVESTDLVVLYQGVCFIGLDSCQRAHQTLEPLVTKASSAQEAARWYSIIAQLQCGNEVTAKKLLKDYMTDSNVHFNRSAAKQLLEELQE